MTDLTESTEREAHLEIAKEASATQIEIIIIDINQTDIDAKVAVLIDEAIGIAETTHEAIVERDEMTASQDIDQTDQEVIPENEITM